MKYQLVLQWPTSSIKDHDKMISLENALIKGLGDAASVEGHDFGSGEMNIFLLTDDVTRAYREAKQILEGASVLIGLKAANREQSGTNYRPIWPPELKSFSVK